MQPWGFERFHGPADRAGNPFTFPGRQLNGPQIPFFSMRWPGRPSHPRPFGWHLLSAALAGLPQPRATFACGDRPCQTTSLCQPLLWLLCLDPCRCRPLLWLWLLCLGLLCLLGLRHNLRLLVCAPIVSEPCRAQPPPGAPQPAAESPAHPPSSSALGPCPCCTSAQEERGGRNLYRNTCDSFVTGLG